MLAIALATGLSMAAPVAPAFAFGAPESFADLSDKVSPAVVNITTTSMVSAPSRGGPMVPPGSPFEEFFRDFGAPFGPRGGSGEDAPKQRSEALGSGFVISEDGFLVTNNHVIEGADEITIEFFSGRKLPAKVIGTDKQTDIALLKVESDTPLPFVAFGNSDLSRVGDWVLAVGNPLGQGFSVSAGIVSARNRELSGTYDDYLQTDAAINRGNSGGPLFNMDGQVVGVNTAILSPNGGSIGIGFSMASNVVTKVVDQLKQFGETRRGWLGVRIQDVTAEIAESLGIEKAAGALISEVMDGPSREAGMKSGDIITSFNGLEIKDASDLTRKVGDAPVGEAVPVIVLREGRSETLSVTLGRREDAESALDGSGTDKGDAPGGVTESRSVLGMTLAEPNAQLREELGLAEDATGLVITEIDQSSAAFGLGLRQGDMITEAGQQRVERVGDLEKRVEDAKAAGRKSIFMMIRRGPDSRFLALPVK